MIFTCLFNEIMNLKLFFTFLDALHTLNQFETIEDSLKYFYLVSQTPWSPGLSSHFDEYYFSILFAEVPTLSDSNYWSALGIWVHILWLLSTATWMTSSSYTVLIPCICFQMPKYLSQVLKWSSNSKLIIPLCGWVMSNFKWTWFPAPNLWFFQFLYSGVCPG